MPRTIENCFDFNTQASVNGETIFEGNYKTIHRTFSQMIERASDNVTLMPSNILGSSLLSWDSLKKIILR